MRKRLQERRCLIPIVNKDELCMARCIVVGVARWQNDPAYEDLRKGRPLQRTRAWELHKLAGVELKACGVEEIKRFQTVLPNYQLVIVSAEHYNSIIYKGPDRDKQIFFYLNNQHYDLIISMPGLLGKSYYCLHCEKGYNTEDGRHHACKKKCYSCFQIACPGDEFSWIFCEKCQRSFKGKDCFANHEKKGSQGSRTVCETYFKCKECGKVLDRTRRDIRTHKCGEKLCHVCDKYVDSEHQCFMQVVKKKKRKRDDDDEPLMLFFDFECTQETGYHSPNLVVVQDIHGKEWVFHSCETFCTWLFDEMSGATCIAHNFKGYESFFILNYLYKNNVKPVLIMNGAKIMELKVPSANVRFIDSLNFFPMALAKLPKTFGFTELKKGFFPHFFNTRANEQYVGSIPAIEYYDPDGMKPEVQREFLRWHDTQKNIVFDMRKELLEYCRSDVDILRRCCSNFISTVQELCHIHPFAQCMTIASLCNLIFRSMFLRENTIAIVPHLGYRKKAKQSYLAYQWLSYESHKDNVRIVHGRNQGEKRVGPYALDGYCPTTQTAYEFQGCFFHGCTRCFPATTVNPISQLTMQELFDHTRARIEYIQKQGLKVIEMWECDWKTYLKENPAAQQFVSTLDMVEPLNPRDAFYGGRTNATKLLVENKTIKYVDFTSLYPDINKNGQYPVGHPTTVTEGLDENNIDQYFGLIKCTVLAPRGLYHPVLPVRCNNKLMFTLCRTCSNNLQQTVCRHDENERLLTGTWVTLELMKALEMGYKVKKVHEVWHFKEKSSTLFKDYIDLFLKKKQEACGFPSWCETDEQKDRYISDYFKHEGILLDKAHIHFNAGARSIWKQILNNMWGKLGQRPNRPKVEVVDNPKRYFELFTSARIKVKDVHLVSEELLEVCYEEENEFVQASDRTNVVLAAFTTAQARLKLYNEMIKLGERVCYYDTDSLVYISEPGTYEPILGDYLGQLTSELNDNDHITTFVSAGPKNYAYTTHQGKTVCKVRGFTLNVRTSEQVNFHSMLSMVKGTCTEELVTHNPHKIVRDTKAKRLKTQSQDKRYKLVYDKRVIASNYDTVPYGY